MKIFKILIAISLLFTTSVFAAPGDIDDDGMHDWWEDWWGFDKNDPSDALLDKDDDKLTNLQEYQCGADPNNPDTDGDGMLDWWEALYMGELGQSPSNEYDWGNDYENDYSVSSNEFIYLTSLATNDTDGDGILDGLEDPLGIVSNTTFFTNLTFYSTSPTNSDTDGDGILDGLEVYVYFTDPLVDDMDEDGLLDGLEIYTYFTSPFTNDTDGDGLPDKWECDESLNPINANDAAQDSDTDGLVNSNEYLAGSDPWVRDSDGDNIWDGWEFDNSLNVTSNDASLDPDKDLADNYTEYLYNSSPHNSDTDSDVLTDGEEINGILLYSDGLGEVVRFYSDPTKEDTDSDGLDDGYEYFASESYPTNSDTDADGILDGTESRYFGDNYIFIPNANEDYDDDGHSNYEEATIALTDPCDEDESFGIKNISVSNGWASITCGPVREDVNGDRYYALYSKSIMSSSWTRISSFNANSLLDSNSNYVYTTQISEVKFYTSKVAISPAEIIQY